MLGIASSSILALLMLATGINAGPRYTVDTSFYLNDPNFTDCSHSSCLDDAGSPVDYWVIYKLPQSVLGDGTQYAYYTPDTPSFTLSSTRIHLQDSMLSRTIAQLVTDDSHTYENFTYNDSPSGGGASYAHAKGLVVMETESTGFWITHSVPALIPVRGDPSPYYPTSGMTYGQTLLCVSFHATEFIKQNIISHLHTIRPYCYRGGLGNNGFCLTGREPSPEPWLPRELTSLGGVRFDIFSKSDNKTVDLYEEISNYYKNGRMLVQAWRQELVDTEAVAAIEMIDLNISGQQYNWSAAVDNGKWASHEDRQFRKMCFGDLNRDEPQTRKGGGAICFNDPTTGRSGLV